eukprot:SAG11_NODE_24493_length_372_cov_1.326007_1_plen_59_part_01
MVLRLCVQLAWVVWPLLLLLLMMMMMMRLPMPLHLWRSPRRRQVSSERVENLPRWREVL